MLPHALPQCPYRACSNDNAEDPGTLPTPTHPGGVTHGLEGPQAHVYCHYRLGLCKTSFRHHILELIMQFPCCANLAKFSDALSTALINLSDSRGYHMHSHPR